MAVKRTKLLQICGIYKVTSPSGKIYIGQSVHCLGRENDYKNNFCKTQRKLFFSIKKHGWNKHKFEIIHVCEPEQLNELEVYYIQLFNSFNSKYGLNLVEGGKRPLKRSEETQRRISQGLKRAWQKRKLEGKVKPPSPETIKLMSDNRKKAWEKQKEDKEWNSPEEIEKRSIRAKNKKSHSVSNQGKENMKKGWVEYKNSSEYNSEESREKRRKINLGKQPWNKGSKGIMKAWNKGIKLTPEQAEKNRQYAKMGWEKKKASGGKLWSQETLKRRSISMKKFYENKKRLSA